jgi:hypothetical protein
MKTKKIFPMAWALAAACSANAAEFSIEGRYFLSNAVQASLETTCEVKFYGTANASDSLFATNGVRLATDVNGCFVLHASAPDHVELPDTFWVGVKPLGRNEISPRFRVAPVPFAFAADEALLLSTDRELELAGVATIERLTVSGDVEAEDFVVTTNSVLKARNLQLDSAKITSLTMPDAGMLGLFNAKGATPSFDYDSFSAEKKASVEARIESSGNFLTHDHSRDRSVDCSYTFAGDGFLLIAIRADSKKCPASKLSATIGGTTIYDRAVGTDKGGVVKRFMTVPYRSGEEVKLKLTAVGGGEIPFREQDSYKSNIGVKLQLVKFGRN